MISNLSDIAVGQTPFYNRFICLGPKLILSNALVYSQQTENGSSISCWGVPIFVLGYFAELSDSCETKDLVACQTAAGAGIHLDLGRGHAIQARPLLFNESCTQPRNSTHTYTYTAHKEATRHLGFPCMLRFAGEQRFAHETTSE